MKRILSKLKKILLPLSIFVLSLTLSNNVYAAENNYSSTRTFTYSTYIDPVKMSKAPVFNNTNNAASYLRQRMKLREGSIYLKIKNPNNNSGNIASVVKNEALADNDYKDSSLGDYLMSHLYFGSFSSSYNYNRSGKCTVVEIFYSFTYHSSLQQENAVDKEVKSVLKKLNVYKKDDYTKVKAVHDYIVKNIKYDNSLSNYSAYSAIIKKSTVCQGYASLTYKMLKELGVPVRVITGTSDGIGHAWNIVKVGGKWYNMDNTWDASYYYLYKTLSYKYFLKGSSNFSNHTRNAEYTTTDFNKKYVMSKYDYVNPYKSNIETPRNNASVKGRTTIRGWYIYGKQISRIDVYIDGKRVGQASRSRRDDVAKAFNGYDASKAGFSYTMDFSKYKKGTHKIQIKAIAIDGTTNTANRTIKIVK